jgi:hypothetical protein
VSDALATRKDNAELAKLDAIDRALAEAETPEEVKRITDKLAAIGAFLKSQHAELADQNAVAIRRLTGLRAGGAMLRDMARKPGQRDQMLQPATFGPTLADLGIERTASHRWQTMAGRRDARSDCRRRWRGRRNRKTVDARGVSFCKCKSCRQGRQELPRDIPAAGGLITWD